MLLLLGSLVLVIALTTLAIVMLSSRRSVHGQLALLEASAGIRREHSIFERYISEQRQRIMAQRFAEAGWDHMTAVRFFTMSLAGLVGGLAVTLVLSLFSGLNGTLLLLLIAVLLGGAGFYAPNFVLDGAIRKRKTSIYRSLPLFLDMVSAIVEAGVALNSALQLAAGGVEDALAQELQNILQDIRLGRSRAEALMASVQRVREPTYTGAITAIVQADKLGGNVADVLQELAQDAREHRLARAEELAGALPNKLVFPMAVFTMPSMFVIIFGALAAKLISGH